MVEEIKNDIDTEKLIKGYVDTVFNIWRMGKDAKLNYEENKKKLDDVNEILDDHIILFDEVENRFSQLKKRYGITMGFVPSFDLDAYVKEVRIRQKSLERTLAPLKSLSKKYERTLKILEKNGFQIMEFDGKKFNDGMSIKVLGYDTKPGVEEGIIIETVKPTIFFNDKEYLKGEVIVSKSPDDDE